MNILVVEDETISALALRRDIESLGHRVTDTVESYDAALRSVVADKPDLALLDIHLVHSRSGIALAHTLRKRWNLPAVFLTADHELALLHDAADTNPIGYIIKPYRQKEIRNILVLAQRKIFPPDAQPLRRIPLGRGYTWDTANRHLYCDDEPVVLSPNETQLLDVLTSGGGTTIPFGIIEAHIWEHPISEGTRRSLVYRLRARFIDASNTPFGQELIQTIPGFGCRLVLP